jgi:hypothetical protein
MNSELMKSEKLAQDAFLMSLKPVITLIRCRSFRLIANVSMVWPRW